MSNTVKIKEYIEVAFIMALIFALFFGLFTWSAQYGGVRTYKGVAIFLLAVALFITPALDKAINIWHKLKIKSSFKVFKESVSILNYSIICIGLVMYIFLLINEPDLFDLRIFFRHIWLLITA